jgi:hypothetical protein
VFFLDRARREAESFCAALEQRPSPEKAGALLRKEVHHGTTWAWSRDDGCGTRTGLSLAALLRERQTGSGSRSRSSEARLHFAPPGLVDELQTPMGTNPIGPVRGAWFTVEETP